DHWIAFVLLSLIGLKMIKESFENENCDTNSNQFGFKIMFALAIGVSFAFLDVDLFLALFLIGSITFILCAIALELGNKFGTRFRNKAEFLGGAVLIILGIKILVEHLFFS
ncbi:manganese efflux pump, partial [Campylobacter coli]